MHFQEAQLKIFVPRFIKFPDKLDLAVEIVFWQGNSNLWSEPLGLRRRETGVVKCGNDFFLPKD